MVTNLIPNETKFNEWLFGYILALIGSFGQQQKILLVQKSLEVGQKLKFSTEKSSFVQYPICFGPIEGHDNMS